MYGNPVRAGLGGGAGGMMPPPQQQQQRGGGRMMGVVPMVGGVGIGGMGMYNMPGTTARCPP